MADLSIASIGQLLAGGGTETISKRTRCSSEKVAKVLSLGIPTMLAGMQKNVKTPEGDASLSKALGDHSGQDTGNVVQFLQNADVKDGKKIVGHVLGDKEDATVERISKASGLSASSVLKILATVAPLLLSLLGNQQSQNTQQSQQNSAQPLQLLTGAAQTQQQSGGLSGLLGGLLGGSSGGSSGGLDLSSLLLGALGGSSQQNTQQETQQDSGGLLSGFLNLFR